MTDLEISQALARAIGWKGVQSIGSLCLVYTGNPQDKVYFSRNENTVHNSRIFDYRDPTVIWQIAERYNCFPYRQRDLSGDLTGKWVAWKGAFDHVADTAAKAVALVVIGGAK